jgi:hypothetical protein
MIALNVFVFALAVINVGTQAGRYSLNNATFRCWQLIITLAAPVEEYAPHDSVDTDFIGQPRMCTRCCIYRLLLTIPADPRGDIDVRQT